MHAAALKQMNLILKHFSAEVGWIEVLTDDGDVLADLVVHDPAEQVDPGQATVHEDLCQNKVDVALHVLKIRPRLVAVFSRDN